MPPRMATQPGRTLSPSPARAYARIQLRVSLSRIRAHAGVRHAHTLAVGLTGEQSGPARGYQYQRPVHRGTEARAINLLARQAATRHCVYPHVNHYVRPRNIESRALRIPDWPFPVGRTNP